jgi:hypothetical protein
MSPKTKPCDRAHAAARLAIAEQFIELAEAPDSLNSDHNPYRANALVSNYVQAGIAAADAICCVELKEHALGESHSDAINLIKKVASDGATLAKDLGALLGMKTNASYGSTPMKANDVLRAQRAADRLVKTARERLSS